MDIFAVQGSSELKGEASISSAKNSVLKLMAASLLYPGRVTLKQVPDLNDIKTMAKLLKHMGVEVVFANGDLHLNSKNVNNFTAPYELVKTMRASILVLGPLLSLYQTGKVSLPGGCAIGARPIDMHLEALKQMGAQVEIKGGYVEASCQRLKGVNILLPFPSVGATENTMMAAIYAEGETTIDNAAREPEIEDLANFLVHLFGVKIEGAGTTTIKIHGINRDQKSWPDKEYKAIGDRIEAATFVIGALMTKSEIKVSGFDPVHLHAVFQKLQEMGAKFEFGADYVIVKKQKTNLKAVNVDTAPYPGFPTDVQAQMVSLMSIVEGTSVMTEHIFENRFMHVPELARMGAKITIRGNSAFVEGEKKLTGAPVMCTDLRASAALLLGALVAEGETIVRRVYHIDRGYDAIDKKFSALGAKIKRLQE
jgi:UDP-N-acetylglucosamine 1-carboxyvinyltransferase